MFCSQRSVRNVPFATIRSQRSVRNVPFATFRSQRSVHNVTFTAFSSQRSVHKVLFTTFCSQRSVHNVLFTRSNILSHQFVMWSTLSLTTAAGWLHFCPLQKSAWKAEIEMGKQEDEEENFIQNLPQHLNPGGISCTKQLRLY